MARSQDNFVSLLRAFDKLRLAVDKAYASEDRDPQVLLAALARLGQLIERICAIRNGK